MAGLTGLNLIQASFILGWGKFWRLGIGSSETRPLGADCFQGAWIQMASWGKDGCRKEALLVKCPFWASGWRAACRLGAGTLVDPNTSLEPNGGQLPRRWQRCEGSPRVLRPVSGAIAANFPSVDIPADCGLQEPKVSGRRNRQLFLNCSWIASLGGFDAFMAANPQLESQGYNEIKKCGSCGKPCVGVRALRQSPCGSGCDHGSLWLGSRKI